MPHVAEDMQIGIDPHERPAAASALMRRTPESRIIGTRVRLELERAFRSDDGESWGANIDGDKR